jgi:hypothetical protein
MDRWWHLTNMTVWLGWLGLLMGEFYVFLAFGTGVAWTKALA